MDSKRTKVESQITRVTVYGDRAVVTRRAVHKLSAGTHYLEFAGLPGDLDAATIRARLHADVPCKLGGVDMRVEYLTAPAQEAAAKLAEQIQQRRDELAGLEAQQKVLLERREFLAALEVGSREQIPKSLSRRILDSEEARAIWTKLFDDLLATSLHSQTVEVDMRERRKELTVLEKQLEDLEDDEEREIEFASVMVEMEKAGQAELEMEYAVWGAAWEPVYNLRLDTETAEVNLESSALVTQTTGEDWNDMELCLSTASPEVSITPPETEPLYLALYVPAPPMASGMAMDMMAAPSPVSRSAKKSAPMEEAEEQVMYNMAERPMAAVESRGVSVTYIVPYRAGVPSDGQPHQVFIGERKLAAKLDHLARPMHLAKAYLRATLTNEGDYFLPAGRANLYRGEEYAGAGTIGPVRPGEELKLSLGVDERLELKLIPRPVKDEKAGLLGKIAKQRRSYKLEVKSHMPAATRLEVEWELPISTNDDLKVKMIELNPKPASQSEDGVAKFMLEIAKEGKAELLVDWEVEYPRERIVQGLPD
jgi:uncharacterized protein (TIGR02231 family)